MNRILSFWTIAFSICIANIFGVTAVSAAPRIKILNLDNSLTYSWGTVSPKQTTLRAKLPIINIGIDTLHIKAVKPACGCTSAPLDKYAIAPGDTSILSVSLKTSGYKGNVNKAIVIESNDAIEPDYYIFIQANILYPISIEPNEYLVFLNSAPHKVQNQKLILRNTTDKDITITDVSASSGEIAYNLSAGTIIKAKATAELSVTFNPISDKAFHGMLNFKTDCPDDDLFRVYIKGVPPANK